MILQVKDIKKIYGEGEAAVHALDGVSFDVEEGEFVAVMGPSGSGKSTLLNILGGLDAPTSGQVILDGSRIDGKEEEELVEIRRKKLAYVFQQYHLLPSLTALENVILPMTFTSLNGQSRDRAYNILSRVGLGKRADHRPAQLSGGEQQRVSIARALANDPALILADEPTGNLDSKTGGEILEVFKELNDEGRTIVMVTHDAEKANVASRIIYLEDGKVVKEEKR
jgi:putative ABC transport system ATP-binding protein